MKSTRPLLTALLAAALSVCLLLPARADFSDVPPEHWARSYVLRAEEAGAVNGVGGGLFDPESSVTEAQFYAMLLRTLSDVSLGSYDPGPVWYDVYLAAAAETGLSDGVYALSPDTPLNRFQMAQVMFNLVRGPRDEEHAAEVLALIPDGTAVPEGFRYAVAFAYSAGLIRGMDAAVARQLKSERMKTELITNVSHDLKTPLTSLISYVDLLKKEGLASENAPGYVEVLDRQSQRLKKLTEDLVEASKASTGNMTVTKEDTDVNLLLSQAAGEYAERLAAAQLTLVTTLTPAEPHIQADGRLLWRVFDNLLSNVCKYAQPGTRVYLSTEVKEGKTQIAFRNVSREPLNISADELMERFVRGDASRNTEGSGLGLSIARSLTELNGGTLELTVDGDLFKATLIF